jgi:hypothetical protein
MYLPIFILSSAPTVAAFVHDLTHACDFGGDPLTPFTSRRLQPRPSVGYSHGPDGHGIHGRGAAVGSGCLISAAEAGSAPSRASLADAISPTRAKSLPHSRDHSLNAGGIA